MTSEVQISSPQSLVDYAKSLDCIHCGLCLQTCPTYRLTGVETSSPRGRIHLMRAVGEGRLETDDAYLEELDFCLLCRHCESVCPAGVEFGEEDQFFLTPFGYRERCTAAIHNQITGLLHCVLYILRVMISAGNNDQVLDTPRHEQLPVMQESEITGTKILLLATVTERITEYFCCLDRLVPVALCDMRAG